MVGSVSACLIPASHADDIPEMLERMRDGERIRRHETVRLRKDGAEIAVEFTISPILDARERVVGAFEIVREVTERTGSEAALRESEERFRRLFDSNLVGLAFWDSQHYLAEANDAYLAIIGCARADFAPGVIRSRDLTRSTRLWTSWRYSKPGRIQFHGCTKRSMCAATASAYLS